MNEFKGTKGKWKVVEREKTDYAPKTNEIQFGDDGECVAEFVENDYDAQLIAHAPEMLESLIKVNNFIIENKDRNYMIELLTREVPELSDLITRATTI